MVATRISTRDAPLLIGFSIMFPSHSIFIVFFGLSKCYVTRVQYRIGPDLFATRSSNLDHGAFIFLPTPESVVNNAKYNRPS